MSRGVVVYVVRHGHIPSHESDVALTAEGWRVAEQVGEQLAQVVEPGEEIRFLHGPARRARETAEGIYRGVKRAVAGRGGDVSVVPPALHPDLCNFRMWVDGRLQEAMRLFHDAVRAAYHEDPSPENAARLAFHDAFWSASDPVGYWLTTPTPHMESPEAVAARVERVVRQQLERVPAPQVRQHVICASHSAPMRAFLRAVLGQDPGEPNFCEYFVVEEKDGKTWVRYRGQVAEWACSV